MRKLSSFTFITLDGYYKGENNDISWHKHGQEEGEFSAESLKAENTLIFGRLTYQMMASFWPSPMAFESFPDVAARMNKAEKIVFSKTLDSVDWKNTKLVKDDLIEEVKTIKASPGNNLTILGSGSIVTQLAEQGLIDEFQIMIAPVAIGAGTPLFKNISQQLSLKLVNSRTFKSGVVLHSYESVQKT